eukprot:m.39863 g.39863  ORF g.39863 m.39863 type:complete len:448 (+) comp18313_c0_seq1:92-1435(+)
MQIAQKNFDRHDLEREPFVHTPSQRACSQHTLVLVGVALMITFALNSTITVPSLGSEVIVADETVLSPSSKGKSTSHVHVVPQLQVLMPSKISAKNEPGVGSEGSEAHIQKNNVRSAKYGFYMHVYSQPAAVIHQVKQIEKYFPDSPIYIMSDGGYSFDGLCEVHKCKFKLCPPANDRWHPWPFLHRLRNAAMEMNAEYTIYIEPDNTVHGPITHEPDSDAGGMQDQNPRFGVCVTEYLETHARLRIPNFTMGYTGSGLAGGSYFKTDVLIDAFSDEKMAEINWGYLRLCDSKRIFSSDFAMPIALSYSGYQYKPWKDIIQWSFEGQPNVTRYAFEHYKPPKPEYINNTIEKLPPHELTMFQPVLDVHTSNGPFRNCMMCWNLTKYIESWGSTECTSPLPHPFYISAGKLCKNATEKGTKKKCWNALKRNCRANLTCNDEFDYPYLQ